MPKNKINTDKKERRKRERAKGERTDCVEGVEKAKFFLSKILKNLKNVINSWNQ